MAAATRWPYHLVSEPSTGLTFDNQSDPHFSYASRPPRHVNQPLHPPPPPKHYQDPYAHYPYPKTPMPAYPSSNLNLTTTYFHQYQDPTWTRQEEITTVVPQQQPPVYCQDYYSPNPSTALTTPAYSSPKSRTEKTTATPQPKDAPPSSRMATNPPRTALPPPRNAPLSNDPPIYSRKYQQQPKTPQEHSQKPTSNSKNRFPQSKTAPNSIPQIQDSESSSKLISYLEHSIENLESMKLNEIMMVIQSINKNLGDTIILLQDSLPTCHLSNSETVKFIRLPHKIWGICLELTKQYPTGYDSELNEFGLLAIALDELIKNFYIVVPTTKNSSQPAKHSPRSNVNHNTQSPSSQMLGEGKFETVAEGSVSTHVELQEEIKEEECGDCFERRTENEEVSEICTFQGKGVDELVEMKICCKKVDENYVKFDEASISIENDFTNSNKPPKFEAEAVEQEGPDEPAIGKSFSDPKGKQDSEVAEDAFANKSPDVFFQPIVSVVIETAKVIRVSHGYNKISSEFYLLIKTADTNSIKGDSGKFFAIEAAIFNVSQYQPYKPPWPPPCCPRP